MNYLSILFVDDDEIERLKFRKICQEFNANYTIAEAKNGKQALDVIYKKNISFNLILTDLNMPIMDGFQLLENLNQHLYTKEIPVVILSSLEDKKNIQSCYNLGARSYFKKSKDFSTHKDNIISILDYWQKVVF
ncbi:MAG: response regulator [Polaribacter sp.]|jgi:CheY-like chemotaxis protein